MTEQEPDAGDKDVPFRLPQLRVNLPMLEKVEEEHQYLNSLINRLKRLVKQKGKFAARISVCEELPKWWEPAIEALESHLVEESNDINDAPSPEEEEPRIKRHFDVNMHVVFLHLFPEVARGKGQRNRIFNTLVDHLQVRLPPLQNQSFLTL